MSLNNSILVIIRRPPYRLVIFSISFKKNKLISTLYTVCTKPGNVTEINSRIL